MGSLRLPVAIAIKSKLLALYVGKSLPDLAPASLTSPHFTVCQVWFPSSLTCSNTFLPEGFALQLKCYFLGTDVPLLAKANSQHPTSYHSLFHCPVWASLWQISLSIVFLLLLVSFASTNPPIHINSLKQRPPWSKDHVSLSASLDLDQARRKPSVNKSHYNKLMSEFWKTVL